MNVTCLNKRAAFPTILLVAQNQNLKTIYCKRKLAAPSHNIRKIIEVLHLPTHFSLCCWELNDGSARSIGCSLGSTNKQSLKFEIKIQRYKVSPTERCPSLTTMLSKGICL